MNREPSSPPHHHYHKRKVAGLDPKHFCKPALYLILVLGSYVFGYLSASSFKSKSENSRSRIVENADPFTASDPTYRFTVQCADPIPPELVPQTILDKAFNGTSPWENFPPPHVSSFLSRNNLKGWGSKGSVFEKQIRRVQPKTIIEVGTFLGASALHMLEITRRLGLDTHIVCVDDFRAWPNFRELVNNLPTINGEVIILYQFMQNVVDAKGTESISFMPFSSATVLDSLCEWGVFADLVVVDAGHEFISAWSDINRGYKILRPGGIIFGHDYFLPVDNYGVRRAVDLFAWLHNFKVHADGEHWVLSQHTTPHPQNDG